MTVTLCFCGGGGHMATRSLLELEQTTHIIISPIMMDSIKKKTVWYGMLATVHFFCINSRVKFQEAVALRTPVPDYECRKFYSDFYSRDNSRG